MNRLLIDDTGSSAVLDPLNSTSGWTASAGSLSVQAPPDGSAACLCMTGNLGVDSDLRRADPDYTIPNGYVLAVDVFSNSPAYYADGNIRVAGFYMDDGIFNHCQWPQLTLHPNGWHTVLVPMFTARGGASGSGCTFPGTGNRHQTFNQLWFRVRGTAGLQTKTWFRNMRLIKARPRTTIILDDGHTTQVSMMSKFDAAGLKVGLAIITGAIDGANSLTSAELDAIIANGHEFYNHTKNHYQNVHNQANASEQQAVDEFSEATAWLDARFGKKLSHRILVHPFGERGAVYDRAALKAGMILGVGTVDGVNAPFLTEPTPTNTRSTYPYISRHIINRTTNTHANNVGWVDSGIGVGGMVCLGYHYESSGAFSGSTAETYVQPDRLSQMCGDLVRRSSLSPVVKLSEWLDDIGYVEALRT